MTTATQINLAERCSYTVTRWNGEVVSREGTAWALVCINDTRCVQKEDGRYKPVGGTGDQVPCECCGKMIEVHALIVHRITKERAVIGTGCAKKTDIDCGGINPLNRNYWKVDMSKRV